LVISDVNFIRACFGVGDDDAVATLFDDQAQQIALGLRQLMLHLLGGEVFEHSRDMAHLALAVPQRSERGLHRDAVPIGDLHPLELSRVVPGRR